RPRLAWDCGPVDLAKMDAVGADLKRGVDVIIHDHRNVASKRDAYDRQAQLHALSVRPLLRPHLNHVHAALDHRAGDLDRVAIAQVRGVDESVEPTRGNALLGHYPKNTLAT